MRCLFLILLLGCCHFAPAQDVFDATRGGDLSRLEALARINPDTLNALNDAGFNPLIIAVYKNQVAVVTFLLERRVKLNVISPEGTALMAACYKKDLDMAKLLIKNGADVHLRTREGSSALLFAVLSGYTPLVKLLLDQGASKTTMDGNGLSVLYHARTRNYPEIVALLEN